MLPFEDNNNNLSKDFDFNRIVDPLKKYLQTHHLLYTKTACKGEYLEELLSKSFNDVGYTNEYAYDHNSKYDLLINDILFQVKSGIIDWKHNTIKFSGSRTSKFSKIDDKLNFINDNKPDFYIFVSSHKFKNKFNKYVMSIMTGSKLILPKSENFELTITENENKTWTFKNFPTEITIQESMSGQFWFTLPIAQLDYIYTVDI